MLKYGDSDNTTYDRYKKHQIDRAEAKWGGKHPFDFGELERTVQKVIDKIGNSKTICCLGIRNGNEFLAFPKIAAFANAEVYGVDICPKVADVGKNCFCCDFNHLPEDWEGKFDLVYSNSADHSRDISETLKEWHRICKKGGYILSIFSSCGRICATDIYSFEEDDIDAIVDKNLFEVCEVWRNEGQRESFNCLLKAI